MAACCASRASQLSGRVLFRFLLRGSATVFSLLGVLGITLILFLVVAATAQLILGK